jgi:hypothetical protein
MAFRDNKSSKSSGFKYQPRTAEDMKKRASQNGSSRDQTFSNDVQMFTPSEGDNNIRILPPTWDHAKHFGYDVYMHYDIGPDGAQYLCLDKMEGKPCPICEERLVATEKGDTEYADKLKPGKRVLVYVIDRDKEKEGVKLWSMSWTIDRDLCALAVDKRTGELYAIDDPEDGYDVSFERKGTGLTTKYLGLQVARRSSSLGNDDWLEQVAKTPIPDLLNYFDYDHIKAQFSGKKADEASDDESGSDDDAPRGRSKYQESAHKEASPARRESKKPKEITYDDVVSVEDLDELLEIVAESGVRCRPLDKLTGDEEFADIVDIVLDCLGLEPPKKARRAVEEDDSPKAKLAAMKERFSRNRS